MQKLSVVVMLTIAVSTYFMFTTKAFAGGGSGPTCSYTCNGTHSPVTCGEGTSCCIQVNATTCGARILCCTSSQTCTNSGTTTGSYTVTCQAQQ